MIYIIVFIALFVLELAYFKIADKYNIIDKPNQRSSHSAITLRGGGIIFAISVLLFFILNQFQYPYFVIGMLGVSAISFIDDIKPQTRSVRFLFQILAVFLMFYQVDMFSTQPIWIWLIALIFVVGINNAYNFMDGINGITSLYSFTVLGGLYLVNNQLPAEQQFNNNIIYYLALGNLVFAYFNCRKKAKCFAGDVGSVSMAFTLLFLSIWVILKTNNIIFILFYALYGVDTVLTILIRLKNKENILEPHRKHVFQLLCNEFKNSQILVSVLFMIVQGAITYGVTQVWQQPEEKQLIFAAVVLVIPAIIYGIIKYKAYKLQLT
ncbi:MraY family glycosyltransferase [Polluticaenibacter yanchengensis]|uniref:Glycosyltransferase family 4 protein n=1 Tax=Polluticaenibacter yanchengensis TaxID=3014562 RepID=A0ABT4UIB4_9BACT|nr:glycosyltransferase family 4 protein [Chitinophagaceae bacterium LY-5]